MNTTLNATFVLILAAVVCFVIALLYAMNVLHNTDQQFSEWLAGGLISFAAGHLPCK